jgi:hypothetical protein
MTALQFPAAEPTRAGISEEQKLEELTRWAELIGQPGAQDRIDALAAQGTEDELVHYTLTLVETHVSGQAAELELERTTAALQRTELELQKTAAALQHTELELQKTTGEAQARAEELADLQRWREELMRTVSWRITRPLRAMRRRF